MKASVGPQAEYYNAKPNIQYGDAMVTARRHLSPAQFPRQVDVAEPTQDNGWIGPLGITSPFSPSGSIYGYGVAADWPHY